MRLISNKLLKATFPFIRPLIKDTWKQLLVPLAITSIILGTFPTIKSGVESNFLNEAEDIFRSAPNIIGSDPITGEHTTYKHYEFNELVNHKFKGINQSNDEGFFEGLPNLLTKGRTLWIVVILYSFLIIAGFLLEYRSERLKHQLSQRIFVNVRQAAFSRVLSMNPSEVPDELNTAGNYTNSVQTGTEYIVKIYSFLGDSVQYTLSLLTAMIVLFSTNWLFAALFLLTLIVQVFISLIRARRLKARRNALEKQRNALAGQTDDILSKKEIILAFEQVPRYEKKITSLSSTYGELVKDISIKDSLFNGLSKLITDFERFLIPLLALIFLVISSTGDITSGAGIFFLISLYTRLSVPILNLLRQYDELKANEAISQSLIDVLSKGSEPEEILKREGSTTDPVFQAVVLKDVCFQYKPEKLVLDHLSFHVPINKTTMILGPSGSGKSSIAKILLGFWPIQSGRIELMGRDINYYTRQQIRLFSSYISQRDFITEETIRENLNWGGHLSGAISDEMMIDALKKVCLVKDNDIGFLDELAKNLSGGEQQRLSLARVMLDEAPLLILDEPLTGIDVYTIMDIMPYFKAILKENDRTVIMISHKLSFANTADHIVILSDAGKTLEEGAPQELLKDPSSRFKKIYEAAKSELILTT